MNKTELVSLIAERADLTVEKANLTLDAITTLIEEVLSTGEKVVITGFGTFEVRDRQERRGKNPRTGEYITIPGQKSPAFRAGKDLKAAVKNDTDLSF